MPKTRRENQQAIQHLIKNEFTVKKLILLAFVTNLVLGCKPEKKEQLTPSENTEIPDTKVYPLNVSKIDSTQFPAGIRYEGFIKNAVRWTDKSGDNIVVTTETGIYTSPKFEHESEYGSDAELFAYHYIVSNNEAKQTWKVYDFISDCPVDIAAFFVKNSFEITDLNKNGIAEIWIMYKTVCHGDVSPSDMKIIMYEGKKKFAMRGENKVATGIDDDGKTLYYGGKYKFDQNFKNAPQVFKDFAKNLWNNNLIDTPEEE